MPGHSLISSSKSVSAAVAFAELAVAALRRI
jgi:hypothetical protein